MEWGGKWYDARVLKLRDGAIRVHYSGWADRHDSWVDFPSDRVRFVPISHQTLEESLQRQLRAVGNDRLDKAGHRALQWHLANLEFACAASLRHVSATEWDQDDKNEYDGE